MTLIVDTYHVEGALSELAIAYRKDFGEKELAAQIDLWTRTLKRAGITVRQLREAVDAQVGSEDRYFPQVGRIIGRAKEVHDPDSARPLGLEDDYRRWMREGQHGPCPVCKAEEPLLGDVVHVHAEHIRAEIPCVGRWA